MLAERQRHLELLLERVDAQRLEPPRLVAEPFCAGQPLQRRPSPQSESRLDCVRGGMEIVVTQRGARLREQLLEAEHVHARICERVAVRGARDRGLSERGAQARDVMVERVPRGGRKLLAPQTVDEGVNADHPAPAERQHRQESLALRPAHVRRRPVRENLEGAE